MANETNIEYLDPDGLVTTFELIHEEIINETSLTATSASPLRKSTASGILGIDAKGKSEQNVSPNVVNANVIKSEDTLSVSGSRVTLSSSSAKTYVSASGEVALKPNTQYTLSFTVVSATTMGRIGLKYNGSSSLGVIVGDKTATSKSYAQTFTTPSDLTSAKIFLYSTFETSAIGNTVFDGIQINEGSSALPYAPYTGTPTPTSSIPIIDASGDVTAIGENLWGEINLESGSLSSSDGSETASAVYTRTKFIPLYGNATVTLFADNWIRYFFYSESKAFISTASAQPLNGLVVNVPSNAKYIRAHINYPIASASEHNIMIAYGSKAEYIPYQSNSVSLPFEPKSVGSAANELIVNEDGSAKIVQRVKELSLNDIAWARGSISDANKKRFYFTPTDAPSLNNRLDILCDIAKAESATDNYNGIDGVCVDGSGNVFFYFTDCNAMTDAQFREWMNAKNAKMYYVLATPIITELTPEQVAIIRALQTYKDITIIDSEMQIDSVTYFVNSPIGEAIGILNNSIENVGKILANLGLADEEEF